MQAPRVLHSRAEPREQQRHRLLGMLPSKCSPPVALGFPAAGASGEQHLRLNLESVELTAYLSLEWLPEAVVKPAFLKAHRRSRAPEQ